jgi:beta-lactamase class A
MKKDINIKNNLESKHKYIVVIFIFLLLLSIILNLYFIHLNRTSKSGPTKDISLDYPLLSKRIFTQNPNDLILNFIPLRKALKEYIQQQNNQIGIYFEYLPSGISIGVNDRDEVRLASLSKVPLAMSILKKVEKNEIKLTDKITLKKEDLDKDFGELWKSGEGSQFSIEELIKYSLINSDNTAYHSLLRTLSEEEVSDVYDNLEIEILSKETKPLVSPKSYSSIFRSLYLSSYLLEEDSNYILNILTKTIFNDKIPAGIPDKNIKIAHKIGTFSRFDTTEKVFTDCGIIYLPNRPYILCMFSKKDNEETKKDFAYISYMIYSYLSILKGGNK